MPQTKDQQSPREAGEVTAGPADAMSPKDTLTLARIEHQLLSLQTRVQPSGLAMERPSRSEGISRVSPLAHLSHQVR